jgi:hypothetical protein
MPPGYFRPQEHAHSGELALPPCVRCEAVAVSKRSTNAVNSSCSNWRSSIPVSADGADEAPTWPRLSAGQRGAQAFGAVGHRKGQSSPSQGETGMCAHYQSDLEKPRMKHLSAAAVRFFVPDDIQEKLERRLGRLHARQRLGIEMDHEAQVFGQGLNFFHIENLLFSHMLLEGVLRLRRRWASMI